MLGMPKYIFKVLRDGYLKLLKNGMVWKKKLKKIGKMDEN